MKNRLEDVDKIIQEIRLSDIFINNAAIEFKQVELFIKLFNEWKYDEDKMIINIGHGQESLISAKIFSMDQVNQLYGMHIVMHFTIQIKRQAILYLVGFS